MGNNCCTTSIFSTDGGNANGKSKDDNDSIDVDADITKSIECFKWERESSLKWAQDPACDLTMEPLPTIDIEGVPVGQHLQLGITLGGMIDFLKRIDFPFWYCSIHGIPLEHDGSYVRDETKLGWVTKKFGPVKYFEDGDPCTKPFRSREEGDNPYSHPYNFRVGSPDPRTLTGYDLAHVITLWLENINKKDFSVCEILLTEQKMAVYNCSELTSELKPVAAVKWNPHAFASHVQRECVSETFGELESGCLYNGMRRKLDEEGCLPLQGSISEIYWWMDYFTLRQCKHDFDIFAMQKVIKQIGCTLVLLDLHFKRNDEFLSYVRRSFCVFEIYCSVVGKANLVVSGASNLHDYLAKNPVRTKNAETSFEADKKLIDKFINEHIENGFEGLDSIISKAIYDGLNHGNNMYIKLPE